MRSSPPRSGAPSRRPAGRSPAMPAPARSPSPTSRPGRCASSRCSATPRASPTMPPSSPAAGPILRGDRACHPGRGQRGRRRRARPGTRRSARAWRAGSRPGSAPRPRSSAVFGIDDPADPFWWDEPFAQGRRRHERAVHDARSVLHVQAGPPRQGGPATIEFGWHAFPDADRLTVSGLGDFRARVGELDARLDAALDGGANVSTALPDILAAADRSLLVSRTGVLLLTVQLVALAAYAVLLSASLLVEHRRVETAMLRSRGAGRARIVGLALIEGLLLTVPAALAGSVAGRGGTAARSTSAARWRTSG